jgi:hypothetical protein
MIAMLSMVDLIVLSQPLSTRGRTSDGSKQRNAMQDGHPSEMKEV